MPDFETDLWEEAYELACQRAREEGDVDIDRDYTLMEAWTDEYYEALYQERYGKHNE